MSDRPDLATLTRDPARERIAILTLNRPDQRNALSIDLLAALHARVDELEEQLGGAAGAAPSVVVVKGAGRCFCAGMDLKQVIDQPGAPEKLLASLAKLTVRLRSLPCVTLAAVNGAAIGGGCGLATVMDLCITHADATLGFPEVDLGLCPAVVAPWVVAKIGGGRGRAVLLRGGTMSGREAKQIGLADELVETRDELEEGARAMAERLAAGGPEALRATKRLLNDLDGSADGSVVRRGAEISAALVSAPETLAALRERFGK